ncbi:hypothetical protein SPSYN_02892 [Sporotomaculum syntrophicum]|uniref:DUF5320 domain-containing protein n=1 Tax=Sporotomaculum syntrophicum TaxID=182264 RepID=A0A9D3AVE2_9FIRM|nr:DUF5320 domain-containing protein [Sporotomaculum syntrophicum]KAF1083980.1 hypothetical protein SPSYN_02892 [Sporotomaculum syntrophicum]
MPRGDGTGPMGQGPMSGRGAGPCSLANVAQSVVGLGLGLALRRRRGSGQWVGRYNKIDQAASTPKELLQEQKAALQRRLEVIDRQLENL